MATASLCSSESTTRTPASFNESPDFKICSTCADADGDFDELTENSPPTLANERKTITVDKVHHLRFWAADVFVATRYGWALQTEADDILERAGSPGLIAPPKRESRLGSEKKIPREMMDTTNDEVIPRKMVGDRRVPFGAVGNVEKAYKVEADTASSTCWPPKGRDSRERWWL